ncbi:polysaccharide ABC transporter ATP-binding protein [Coraliomargarita algicola]|uniref:Polysaccharide ABC transporter ATP-binding protein n=1 Tax=Coraliomargarita algicola TaxID=3092156 RepID=A0ABZ0RQF3_9BACT|nr:polysaccharide ABC transporter ATP-binding protein [Coraliomargarita sp. J2-16]WPJ97737.1 polysaccharide ABC transporter ATP-binding protein [Coraliomargarita sp. J2-16]
MSHPIAIKAENLSKCYKLGQFDASSLREEASQLFQKLKRQNQDKLKSTAENDFWALKDINFEIKQGDVVGVIGRNGAGKSTLLKLISRITTPSAGQIRLRGKVAALLEVGTGFHQELTGRENIYLNGTILGMKKREIDRKLDEIIEFSGIEKHIDTPVKRYSSGMNVRLGFAVAAHLEPDILIVDEVLAVGDQDFQKKCLSKMQDISGNGRTVLFVSHNMASIRTICNSAILLSKGQIECQDLTDKVIQTYVQGSDASTQTPNIFNPVEIVEKKGLRVKSAEITSRVVTSFPFETSIELENNSDELLRTGVSFGFRNTSNEPLLHLLSDHQAIDFEIPARSSIVVRCKIPALPLVPGEYILNLVLGNKHTEFCNYQSAFLLHVEDGSFEQFGHMMRKTTFPMIYPAKWEHESR